MLKTLCSLGMLLFLVLFCLAIGQLGVYFTQAASLSWYNNLLKPSWIIPNFVFPLAWTFLYLLMAISAWLVWRRKNAGYSIAFGLWILQLILNALWTPIFFGQQSLLWGLIIMGGLWFSLLITTLFFFKQSKLAFIFMCLYLLWVSYVTALTFMIWQMNHY